MADNGVALSKRSLLTEAQGLLNSIEADDLSHQELLSLYNTLNTIASRRAARPRKILEVLNVCTPEIASYLTFQEAIQLFQVCRATRHWKRNGISSMVVRLLKNYVSDPGKLRGLMRHLGGIISGSSVLWLIDSQSDSWEPKDLDIYVPESMAQTMIDFLLQEGYKLIPAPEGQPWGGRYIEPGHLASVSRLSKGNRKIGLMESLTKSSTRPIAVFHSTAVMNYITADSIVIMYPKLSFSRMMVRNHRGDHASKWERKYKERMFHLFHARDAYARFQHALCTKIRRYTADPLCLSISFGDKYELFNRDELFADWIIEYSVTTQNDPHELCTQDKCRIAYYHRKPADELGVEVIARATYSQ
ncbi:hypothetical protein CPB86DRAFT_308649 [Serendipita vermifera]|nr:hypothetical protein CPB86DRAFT_308649 [Serendipita vermifera]